MISFKTSVLVVSWMQCNEMHLGSALELAPTLLESTASHVTSTVSNRASAGVGSRARSRVLAAEAGAAAVVTEHGVTGTATADVVDGGSAAQVALKLLVETEDGALAAVVDVAGASAACHEGCWGARVEAGQRGWTGCGMRGSRLGVLEANDVARTTTAGVDCWAACARHRGVRFNDLVI